MQENKKKMLFMLIAFIALLSTAFVVGGRHATKNMQVLYISQAEILNMEKKRIENDSSDKQLFFGKPETAIKYIERVASRKNKSALVLLTDSKIYGENVRSISKEVHEEIIKNLAQFEDRK